MKKIFMLIFFFAACVAAHAQKTEFRFQDTQARVLDVQSNSYVKPLTCELRVTSDTRKSHICHLSKATVEIDMKGDLTNIRSYAVFAASKVYNCDVFVAATFNIHTNEQNGYDVEIVGFPANFVNWKTATQADYEWIRMEKTITTGERERVNAAIKQ